MGQGNTKGPDPLSSDQPARLAKDLTPDEQKQLVIKFYKELRTSFESFSAPDGSKETPAKTAGASHHLLNISLFLLVLGVLCSA